MPLIAAIPAIVGGVTSVVSAVKNSNAQKKQLALQQQAVDKQNQVIDQQMEGSKLAYDYAKEFFPKINEYLSPVGNRARRIFTGDATAINEEIRPEMDNYLNSVRQQEQYLNAYSSRGTTGTRLIDSFFRKSADVANMRSQARSNAGNTLQNLGSIYANIASANLANASGSSASANNALTAQQSIAAGQLNALRSEGQGIGRSIGQLLGLFNWRAKSLGDFFGMSGSSGRPRVVGSGG